MYKQKVTEKLKQQRREATKRYEEKKKKEGYKRIFVKKEKNIEKHVDNLY
jgi:hypothetical protein